MKKKHSLTLSQKRTVNGYLFILPWLVGFAAFYIRSLFMTIQFSLSDLTVGVSGYSLSWVGLKNYLYAFTAHGSFKQILTSSVINMVVDVPLIIFFSLFMALMLNRKFRGRTLVRAIFFLPVILNAEAIVDAIETAAMMVATGVSSSSQEMAQSASGGIGIGYYIDLFGNLMISRDMLEYIVGAVNRITSIVSASGESDPAVEELIRARAQAKKEKNYAEADRLRAQLREQGVELTDLPNGASWKRV